MKKVYTTQNLAELYLLNDSLNKQNIVTYIKNEHPPAAGEVTRAVAWPELWVMKDDDYQRAQQIINDFIEQQQKDLQSPSWHCAQCGESVPGQFALCWQCGATREGHL